MKKIKYILVMFIFVIGFILTNAADLYAYNRYDNYVIANTNIIDIQENYQATQGVNALRLGFEYEYFGVYEYAPYLSTALYHTYDFSSVDYVTYLFTNATFHERDTNGWGSIYENVSQIIWIRNLEGNYGNIILMTSTGQYVKIYDLQNMMPLDIELWYIQDTRDPINAAYWNGRNEGFDLGLQEGFSAGYNEGHGVGYQEGHDVGYQDGFESNNDYWPVLWGAVTAPFALFEVSVFPGVTLGMIALIPIVFGLIGFLFSLGGRKK